MTLERARDELELARLEAGATLPEHIGRELRHLRASVFALIEHVAELEAELERRRLPPLEPVDPGPALELLALVDPAEVEAELEEEAGRRELRKDRRECRGSSGHPPRKCGGCQWVLRTGGQCPRCGYTEGYGYPR